MSLIYKEQCLGRLAAAAKSLCHAVSISPIIRYVDEFFCDCSLYSTFGRLSRDVSYDTVYITTI